MKNQNLPEQENINLKNEYVKTPKHFSDTVEKCVQQQLLTDTDHETENAEVTGKKRWRQKQGFGWSKAAACVLIAAVALSGTAVAATHFHLLDYKEIDKTRISEEDIDVLTPEDQQASAELPGIHQSVTSEQDFPEPLMEIREVYFDGAVLYIYGEATEEGKKYCLGSDHALVNGVDYFPGLHRLNPVGAYTQVNGETVKIEPSEEDKVPGGDDQYYGQIQLADAELTEDFTVELIVGAGWEDEDKTGMAGFQTITFQVSVDNNKARIIDPQTIAIEDGYVEIEQLLVSPSTTHMRFNWHLGGEGAEEKIRDLSSLYLVLTDDEGKKFEGSPTEWETSVYQDEDGMWCTQKDCYFSDIPADTSTLTVHPVSLKLDENDEAYAAGECDYADFTVSFD